MTDKKLRNTPRHLQLAIRDDEELTKILGYVTIFQGGELPFIHTELLPWNSRAKKAKTSQSTTTTKGPRGRSSREGELFKASFHFQAEYETGIEALNIELARLCMLSACIFSTLRERELQSTADSSAQIEVTTHVPSHRFRSPISPSFSFLSLA